jgi:hypothetical protein
VVVGGQVPKLPKGGPTVTTTVHVHDHDHDHDHGHDLLQLSRDYGHFSGQFRVFLLPSE